MQRRVNVVMDAALTANREAGGALARTRIGITYLWRHRRLPDLQSPVRFTEMVQLRKLHDRDARLPMLADKLRVKEFVAGRIGAEWVIPTLWHGTDLPVAPPWPVPFVVKSRHGCNQRIFVRSAPSSWSNIRRRAMAWLGNRYGWWLDEWAYGDIPRGVLVEPFMSDDGRLPVDWKLFVFGGRVQYIQVHLDRESNHRWIVMNRQWQRASAASDDPDPAPPVTLDRIIAAAETLARGFDFVRVDFYEINGQPLFGEMTFYPGSGLDPVDPPALDRAMGRAWMAAQQR